MTTPSLNALRAKCERCDNSVKHGRLCNSCIADDIDDFDSEPEMSEDDEFLEWHCGMMADGYCFMAGSEDCDWSCPRSRLKAKKRIERMKAKGKPLPLFALGIPVSTAVVIDKDGVRVSLPVKEDESDA